MNNVMLDLETWGTRPGSSLRSIGAVVFDPHTDEIGPNEFYANIMDDSCKQAGLTKDDQTVEWWSRQSQKAQDSLVESPLTLTEVASSFNQWFRKQHGIFVWGQGANFDPVLWECAMRAVQMPIPWKFYDVRDTRTVYDVAQFDSRSVRRTGTYHNALDDARHQAVCVQRAYAKINGRLT